jgi:sec-independent protein translocase protein TatA
MGLDNPIHIALILVVLLLVFGAKRLPEMGRSLGSGLRGFKESISGEPERALAQPISAASAISPQPTSEQSPTPPVA